MGLQVLDKITIRKSDSIYIGSRKINKSIYNIFYDKYTRLYWWKPINSIFKAEDNYRLQSLYNNVSEAYNNSKQIEKKNKKAKIVRVIGTIVVAISMWLSMPLIDSKSQSTELPIAFNLTSHADSKSEDLSEIQNWRKVEEFLSKDFESITEQRRKQVGTQEFN